ncbi:MAG: Ig-like domain-containing protein [Gemmatimonadota bacterium]|nr:Ig-like domain-containing protein [Gemmatimonadota bacterium]
MRLIRVLSAAAVFSVAALGSGCGGGGGGGTDVPPVGPAAAVSAVSGTSGSVVAGAATAIALTAKVTDAGGHAVSGSSVSWGTASGSISPAASTSDVAGQATAQWTPGNAAGAQTATASVSGAGSATFTATVAAAALAKIKLAPDTTKLTSAGQTSQLSITGLDAFNNTVPGFTPTFVSDAPNIATINSVGLVTAVANGTTTVRALSGLISGTATVVVNITATNPCPASALNTLAVGGSVTLTGPQASAICINGATGAEFVAVPFYGTGNGGTGSGQGAFTPAPVLSFTLNPLTNTTVSGPPNPSVGVSSQGRASVSTTGERGLVRDVAWEAKFRERVRRQFGPLRQQAQDAMLASSGLRKSIGISAAVNVGDKLSLNVNVNQSCSNPQFVPATVKVVSAHAIIAEDDRNPANGLNDADYQSIASQFDSQVWTVDTDNFGPPTDIDKNGRVIMFFTRAVNELTPTSNTTSFVGGFFFGRDLYPPTTPCDNNKPPTSFVVGSNNAEMFYMLAPDPTGVVNSHVRSTAFVKNISIGTVAHEFQHLINFGYRLYDPTVFTAANFPEQPFLDEGLAHIAEELNFYAATAQSSRANLDASRLVADNANYLAFGNQNAVRFREYLKNPDKYPPYSVLADTSLAVRGGIWSLLRYAADRRSSVPEKTTWLKLVRPGQDVGGMTNLVATFGSDILSQIRDWTVANYLDDAGVSNTASAYTEPSWNTRSVETYVNGTNQANGTVFPLKVGTMLSAPVDLTLSDGGAAYLRFGVAAGQIGGATITSSGALPAAFSVTVVRTK